MKTNIQNLVYQPFEARDRGAMMNDEQEEGQDFVQDDVPMQGGDMLVCERYSFLFVLLRRT
jgi:hypothetical protein